MSYKLDIQELNQANTRTKKCVFSYIQMIYRTLNTNIGLYQNIPSIVHYFCLAYYPRFPFNKMKLSLQEAIEMRPTKTDVADLGYVDDSGMAPCLQPTALRINALLTMRRSKNYLLSNGILQPQIDTVSQPKRKKKKKKFKRYSSHCWSNDKDIHWVELCRLYVSRNKVNIEDQLIVFGFIRNVSTLLTNKPHLFSNPPPLIFYICLYYYYIDEYYCGDTVLLTKNRTGIIKYIGTPHFSRDLRIGVELDKWS
eukprot:511912_1